MKEVFAFTGLALFPHLLKAINIGKKDLKKIISSSLLGILSALAILVGYLVANQSLGEYKSILSYKSTQFSLTDSGKFETNLIHAVQYPKERFMYFGYETATILFATFCFLLILISLKLKIKKSRVQTINMPLPKKIMEYGILLFFWFGSTIGYMFQGRFGYKYEMPMILPMLLIISLSVKIILKSFTELLKFKIEKKYYFLISATLIALFLLPKKFFFLELYQDITDYNFSIHTDRWLNLENSSSLEIQNYIKSKTEKSDCITAVYGWGVGSLYYYAQRPSCSKYFLINILPAEKYEEYRKEIINNPPEAIVYISQSTDMNIEKFEKSAFNFSQAIENCYLEDSEFSNLYWSKLDQEEMKECLLIGNPK